MRAGRSRHTQTQTSKERRRVLRSKPPTWWNKPVLYMRACACASGCAREGRGETRRKRETTTKNKRLLYLGNYPRQQAYRAYLLAGRVHMSVHKAKEKKTGGEGERGKRANVCGPDTPFPQVQSFFFSLRLGEREKERERGYGKRGLGGLAGKSIG